MTQNGINTILDMEKPMVSRSEHEPKKRVDFPHLCLFTQGYPTHAFLWIHLECDGCDGEIPGVLWGYFFTSTMGFGRV